MEHLPGFSYCAEWITAQEEQQLIQRIETLHWEHVSLFGQIAKRRVMHWGMRYDYGQRKVWSTAPIPDFLQEIKARGALLFGADSNEIAEVLITQYPAHAGIGWHRDAPVFESICGISLNSPSMIHFRKRTQQEQQIKMILEPRSAYALTDEARWDWEHRIAPVKQLRYSITLRTLKKLS